MTFSSRLLLLALAFVVPVAPFVTLQALYAHLGSVGRIDWAECLGSSGVVALMLIGLVSLIPAAGLPRAAFRWWVSNRQVTRLLRVARPAELAGVPCFRVCGDDVALFTARMWKPVIVVSDGAVASLSEEQMTAGLLHELAHQRKRDVLWRSLLVAVTDAFGFVPGTRKMVAAAMLRSECAADDEAVRRGAGRRALFDAIVSAANSPTVPCAAGLADSAVAFRLQRIATPALELPRDPFLGLTLRLALLAALPLAGRLLFIAGMVCTAHF
ncbi:MAG TPA: M56 family metallopeptidase [Tepidiformaceae bacterium]